MLDTFSFFLFTSHLMFLFSLVILPYGVSVGINLLTSYTLLFQKMEKEKLEKIARQVLIPFNFCS